MKKPLTTLLRFIQNNISSTALMEHPIIRLPGIINRTLSLLILLPGLMISCTEQEVIETDVCIYGATSAGIIAACSSFLLGKDVVLADPACHLGGLSSGGLGQTDIGNKFAVTGLSRKFYRDAGQHYGELEAWTFEPHVADSIFRKYLAKAGIQPLLIHRLIKVTKHGRKILKIHLAGGSPGKGQEKNTRVIIRAKVFIDCTYEGDLMAMSGVSYTVGREANTRYDETWNGVHLSVYHQFPDGIDPYLVSGDSSSGLLWGISRELLEPEGTGDRKVQAYNYRVCLTDSVENMIPITRPVNYDSSRYELLLRLIGQSGIRDLYHYFIWSPMPNRKTDINNHGAFSTDYIGMNWDYPDAGSAERARIINEHRDYTLGLFYFLGNDLRVPEEIRSEMNKWGLPADEYTGSGHFSPQLYIREARRMTGEYMMTEHNCTGSATVDDGIGLAAYTMDSHNCQRIVVNGMVKNEGDVQIGGFPPYPVSYRSLVPKRDECTNLLVPVCLSASHIAFGSIRMEPVFMVLAQSSAIAASLAIDQDIDLQDVDAAAIRLLNETDPYLDGTPPDILIDNRDTTRVTVEGNWITRPQGWVDKSYFLDFLINTESASPRRKAGFSFTVPETGRYALYYYCPDLSGYDQGDGIADRLPCLLTHSSGYEKFQVSISRYPAKWSPCGIYPFDTGATYSLTVDAGNLPGTVAADAILLIKTN
jgi:hypothetical protein